MLSGLAYDESHETSLARVSWVLALHFFALAVCVPVLPALLLEAWAGDSGGAARCSGILSGLRSLLEFCAMPALGALSDCRGRKPVISLGLAR